MTKVQRRARIALTIGKPSSPRALASRANYIAALERARAEVIVLEPGQAIPADIDGLCLAGGPDISPARYGESDPTHMAKEPDLERDDLEFGAIDAALRRDIPVLGICRGFQLINVALGGRLVLNVDHLGGGRETLELERVRAKAESVSDTGLDQAKDARHRPLRAASQTQRFEELA